MRDRWGTQGTCAIAGHELAHHRVQISHVRAVRTARATLTPGVRGSVAVGAVALQGAFVVLVQRVEQHAQALVCVLLEVVEEVGGAEIVAEGLHEGVGLDRFRVLSTPHVRAQAFEGHQQLAPAALLLLWLRNHRRPSCKV